jgi:uncharacterized protein
MIQRLISPTKKNSFFLFGARGTGKSTFLHKQFKMKNPWFLDLLDPEIEDYYARAPKRLEQELKALKKKPDWVVIDEVQKVPRLLDMIHLLIERDGYKFILTGSSARKLKRGGANLLAGRAFVTELFPLTSVELGKDFDLIHYLHWGGLPKIYSLKNDQDRRAYLSSYVLTYLNEEIRLEQVVRKLDPFRSFLEVVGQVSGKIINHAKIGKEIGVDTKTIQSYFQILEDTLLGFYLPAFHESVRKSQKISPKFYFFDTGIKKALEGSLEQKPVVKTSVFGELFESMVLLEIFRLNKYYQKNFRLSYFATKNNAEIDLVLTKNRTNILIEIKSSDQIDDSEVNSLAAIASDFPNVKATYYVSRHLKARNIKGIECLHWQDLLKKIINF